MMFKCVVQAGHINSQYSSLGLASGAPGEQELTLRIADRLSGLLREKGFVIFQTDANANSNTFITGTDFDLFLALHADADYAGDLGSGFADYPAPETDGATAESQRICKVINETYFPEVKINYVNRSNANTRFYYMWKFLSAKTPCVLIEMGQIQDPHDRVLLANTELIAGALSKSICKAFGVVEPPVAPPEPPVEPKPPIVSCQAQDDLIAKIKSILWNKGYVWAKLRAIKELLPQ